MSRDVRKKGHRRIKREHEKTSEIRVCFIYITDLNRQKEEKERKHK